MSGIDRWYFDVETDDCEMDDDGDYVLYSDHAAEIARLRAEVEAYRKDAERYRFIRDADRCDEHIRYEELLVYADENLDEAIDAAMGADA